MVKIADALAKANLDSHSTEHIAPAQEPEQSRSSERQRPAKKSEQSRSAERNTQAQEPEQIVIPSPPERDENARIRPVPSRSAVNRAWDERLLKAVNDEPYTAEIFKKLRSRILHPGDDKKRPQTAIVISASSREGKSFVTANLGIAIAQSINHHCLMVDCDLRRPTLSSLFGVDNSAGLVDYLRAERDIDQLLVATSLDKLSLLPSGKSPKNPAELLGSSRMRSLIKDLSDRYRDRVVLFDCPPTLAASETLVLANQMDGVIVVVREGGAKRSHLQKLIDSIEPNRLLGIVFNGHKTNVVERSLSDPYGGYY